MEHCFVDWQIKAGVEVVRELAGPGNEMWCAIQCRRVQPDFKLSGHEFRYQGGTGNEIGTIDSGGIAPFQLQPFKRAPVDLLSGVNDRFRRETCQPISPWQRCCGQQVKARDIGNAGTDFVAMIDTGFTGDIEQAPRPRSLDGSRVRRSI